MYCGGCGREAGERPDEKGLVQTNGKISEALPTLRKIREDLIAKAEKDYLERLLAVTKGDIAKACEISGLCRSRLYVLKKRFEI
jgi:transcriptional regulator of acetoin/glycerol metabolism